MPVRAVGLPDDEGTNLGDHRLDDVVSPVEGAIAHDAARDAGAPHDEGRVRRAGERAARPDFPKHGRGRVVEHRHGRVAP